MPRITRPGARSSSVENVAARNAGLRTHMLTTPEPSLMRSVTAPNAASGIGRLAHEPALGLPHRLEARGLGVLRVAHAVADRVRVLEVERDAAPSVRAPPSARNRRAACSAARARISAGVDAGRAVLVEHDLAVDLDAQRAHAGRVREVPRLHRRRTTR